MEKIKTYYPYIDGLKGISILLMVMAHALAWSYEDPEFLSQKFCEMTVYEFNSSFVWKIIYSFHMPLLFAVSGFLFYKPIEFDWTASKSLLKKRVTRLLVPYIVTGISVYFLKGYFGYWFLQILFIVNVIVVLEYMFLNYLRFPARSELIGHTFVYCVLFVVCKILGHFHMPSEFNNITRLDDYYLAFMMGIMIHKYPAFENWLSNTWTSFVCFLLYIAIFAHNNSLFHLPVVGVFVPLFAIAFLYACFKDCNFQMGETVREPVLNPHLR